MVSSARVAHTDTNGEALKTILLASGTLHCVEDVVSCGLTEASGQDVGSQGIDAAAWQQTRWVYEKQQQQQQQQQQRCTRIPTAGRVTRIRNTCYLLNDGFRGLF